MEVKQNSQDLSLNAPKEPLSDVTPTIITRRPSISNSVAAGNRSEKSTRSKRASVLDRSTAKINFRVSSREAHIIRESWAMMLSDELTSDMYTRFYQKLNTNRRLGISSSPFSSARFSEIHKTNIVNNSKQLNVKTTLAAGPAEDVDVEKSLFAIQFYENLIHMDSTVEKMFPSIRHQAVSFSKIVNNAVNNMENIHALDTQLKNISKRHARILSIDNQKFEVMGLALLKTFQDRFGSLFTIELEECWSKLYSYLANCLLLYGNDPILLKQINESYMCETSSLHEGEVKPAESVDDDFDFPIPEISDDDEQQEEEGEKERSSTASRRPKGAFFRPPTKTAITVLDEPLPEDTSKPTRMPVKKLYTNVPRSTNKVPQGKRDCIVM
ncbi:hypothetical protein KAFR_0A08010 [Kazachstania africana CBS 2517]|uniref:Globin domain-containing protein n=1 Tax=Kazachstania africana (strain ATCC 22294 / BCRC 22015 / CBS 2517 / CECT 1963 / NBRC 1671 / NRRL Y-8276) TaxID=1071382 RepID=H2APD5_KAZAF|nr:hypothetical protein KAFR_0A08010 [Kazachstania africana CBS 2517]CCF56235.1 hypothetical protein KAFR_0A08010 [Kazachstania africana CBS 2517]